MVLGSVFLGPHVVASYVLGVVGSDWSQAVLLAQIIGYVGLGYYRYRIAANMPVKWVLIAHAVVFPLALCVFHYVVCPDIPKAPVRLDKLPFG